MHFIVFYYYLDTSSSYLFLGGTLSSVVTFLCFAPLLSYFFPALRYDSYFMILVGIVVYSLYILYDTQLLIKRAERFGGTTRGFTFGSGSWGDNNNGNPYNNNNYGEGHRFDDSFDNGDKYANGQHYIDAINLLLDFVNLFLKLLQLLQKLQQDNNRKKRN